MSEFQKGDKVVFVSSSIEQVRWGGGNTDPEGILIKGNTYIVEKADVHTWHTKLYLEGIDGKFNSVSFEKSSL